MTEASPRRRKVAFKEKEDSAYATAGESMTVADKLKVLEELGKPELITIFKNFKPGNARKRKSAPLDQRVAISVTGSEKLSLDNELKELKASGEAITASQYIRNSAMATLDMEEWRTIALKALEELDETVAKQAEYSKRARQLEAFIDGAEDDEEEAAFAQELSQLNGRLAKVTARNLKRNIRLSGRMTMVEAETIKWRAQRLCISTSDYLRMAIFKLQPDSSADCHMSLDAKRRFYVSIVDVADNGWGHPPTVYECSHCVTLQEEIEKLRDRVAQFETFG